MKAWLNKAVELLKASIEHPRHELNELDWKAALSPNKQRLSQHLSAFGNHPGGGFFVFGVSPQGEPFSVSETQAADWINQLTSLGRDGLEPPLTLDHVAEYYREARLLFVHVQESPEKPVRLRGKNMEHAFIRSGGTTRQASRQEIGNLLLHSRTPRWEELRASIMLTVKECVSQLNVKSILEMLKRPVPTEEEELLNWMVSEKFVLRESTEGVYVTNLGAIAAARSLADFPDLSRKAVRLIIYQGTNKVFTKGELEGKSGYAIAFQGLIDYMASVLPQSEVIEQALRGKTLLYPEIALREIVANALTHQDFSVTGAGPMIEIFSNRSRNFKSGRIATVKKA